MSLFIIMTFNRSSWEQLCSVSNFNHDAIFEDLSFCLRCEATNSTRRVLFRASASLKLSFNASNQRFRSSRRDLEANSRLVFIDLEKLSIIDFEFVIYASSKSNIDKVMRSSNRFNVLENQKLVNATRTNHEKKSKKTKTSKLDVDSISHSMRESQLILIALSNNKERAILCVHIEWYTFHLMNSTLEDYNDNWKENHDTFVDVLQLLNLLLSVQILCTN